MAEAIQIALVPKCKVDQVPIKAPIKNETIMMEKSKDCCAPWRSCKTSALYAAWEAARRFPVTIVELYGHLTSVRNEDI